MNKLTKSSLATGAGLVLLLGGTGTFMSWQDNGNIAAAPVSAGHLVVQDATGGTWSSSIGGVITEAELATYQVVPGETLTYTSTLAVDAEGDELKVTPSLAEGSIQAVQVEPTLVGGALSPEQQDQQDANNALEAGLVESAAFEVDSTAFTQTATDSGVYDVAEGATTVTVIATIQFPAGTAGDNTTQDGEVSLGAMAMTLTQAV